MRISHTACLIAALLLTGCKQVDGTYYPGCAAFEGDKIVLHQGSVVWDRFTDQIIVDVNGQALDPFPEFPKRGTYELDGDALNLRFPDDDVVKTLHVRRVDERVLLLNAENLADWQQSGVYGDCVLTLAPDEAT